MDHKFLDYYNRELIFMKEMSREFAEKHPKIAARLGMHGIEVADPYAERLIEAFCFLSARTQIKLDAEFPKFTQRLLDIVYPNYNSPTPSMGVVQLTPNLKEGDLTRGYLVPKNSAFYTKILPGENSRCEFRNGQEVTLWPLKITEARLTSIPPDLPNLEKYRVSHARLKGALRIKLRLQGDQVFSQLEGLHELPLYIDGDESVVSHIFELVHTSNVAMIIRSGGTKEQDVIINQRPVAFEGLKPDQTLLPMAWNMFHGHNLIHEYFACRQRFYFFTLTQLGQALRLNHTNETELIILLDRLPQELIGHVEPSKFLLFCTPVINLFSKVVDRIEVNRALNSFHVVPDRSRPMDFEIFSINKVLGQQAEKSEEVVFNPLYQTRHCDYGNFGRYFSIQREARTKEETKRKYDTRTPYLGTEVFVSLVDQEEAPYADHIRYLTVEAMVTNRDLPRLISRNTSYDLSMNDAVPLLGATFICQPSAPRAPFALGESAWRLIRQLSFNYLPLSDMDHSLGGESLRNMLRLFLNSSDHQSTNQVNSLVGCKSEPVTRRLPSDGLLVYGRGVRCTLTVDEEGFSGISPYLFGLIMENYLSRHAAINIFTETQLHSMQRGLIASWQGRPGKRGAL
ncbi:type VI secretion system baseplate subunit TssF [Erwinia psidii]|uniref:Type VI secretion system baseplate subunit TssF n=1 Tax=Erwinia psidii TaxID=69224 RepID=A0A3N6S0K1_9GAMM|nr:type VI secretion system baseplate subunit TssF [Erwinia psidii]MCX8958677.1 type VI secretion system baseplate subunit TssF [Erwinia psidii]MCX8961194.1 type VI secretion system baseplate subunit TssF [Erwinia psidii]MCX8966834.1 type VI secretion system baseplate subunit TssF [Erwinia psidii]RQM39058.1 type VI secretion system baseplate subunit TssF [Erwinia psidii]